MRDQIVVGEICGVYIILQSPLDMSRASFNSVVKAIKKVIPEVIDKMIIYNEEIDVNKLP